MRYCLALGSSGRLWKALPALQGFGRLCWAVLRGFERLWEAFGGIGSLWDGLEGSAGFAGFCEAMGSFERLWEALESFSDFGWLCHVFSGKGNGPGFFFSCRPPALTAP